MSGLARPAGRPLPSIRSRLANALVVWSLVWGAAVGAAVWLAAAHEVDELLDDALQSSAELLAALVARPEAVALPAGRTVQAGAGEAVERFAWQVTAADGSLQLRSARAPTGPWRPVPAAGFGQTADWRFYGLALGSDGRMLYAAQTRAERREARAEVALGAVLAAFAVGWLGHVWLRSRVRSELQPLQTLADRLEAWDVDDAGALAQGMPPEEAERRELQPVHRALSAVTERLALRIANEQAFSAHAAHALRTPLAGIDVQLAVALRECPPPLRERLQRVREAAGRLQGVVAALLGLFRTGSAPRHADVDLEAIVSRLPVSGLEVRVEPGARLRGDADLLAAALLNLVDNAQRHGARRAWIEMPGPGRLRVRDDGPGLPPARRAELQAALDAQAYEGATGLGLMLADRVARVHGGRLRLCPTEAGFAVELALSAGPPAAEHAAPRPGHLQDSFSTKA